MPDASERPLTEHIRPNEPPLDLKNYEAAGGYGAFRAALGNLSSNDVQEMVKRSNLKGRGGAGFDSAMKWSFMPLGDDKSGPSYLAVNADEMEPGTFKDCHLLEGNPHQVIEGAMVTAYAVQADVVFIFLRWAYKLAEQRIRTAIAEAYEAGYLGKNIQGSGYDLDMHLHVSAGRYMCGEETGLLNALEGKRARPRSKPPYPQASGAWGRPTLVHNVETLCNVPHIVARGPEWFKGLSRCEEGGTKIYGASGRVKRPGLWELPLGTTLGEVLHEHAGGMQDGYAFRGVLPGGASTSFLLEDHMDVPLDFEETGKAGSRLGTGALVVLDDKACPVGMMRNLERFFAQESCGWCTPCREGLPWTYKTLTAIEEGQGREGDLEQLTKHCGFMGMGHTYCALAPGAVMPLESALKYFRDDFERHIREHRCPWKDN